MSKHLVVTRSCPVTQKLPLALHKLAEGTVSTDPLVATPFFFFFLTQNIWDKGSGAQGTSRGFDQLKKGHEAVRVTLPYRVGFIERFLERTQNLDVRTYHLSGF